MYYEMYRDVAGLWRWRLRAANHEIISSGEAYASEYACSHAISLNKSSHSAPTYKK